MKYLKGGNLTLEMSQVAKNENRNEVKEAREKLFNYYYTHYGVKFIPKSIQELLKQLNNGTSKKYEDVQITYDQLLDMLQYYEQDLLKLYGANLKYGNLKTPNQRMAYDITIMIDSLNDYNSRRRVVYNEINNTNENSIEDYSIYLEGLQKSRIEEAEEEFKLIEELHRISDELSKLDE